MENLFVKYLNIVFIPLPKANLNQQWQESYTRGKKLADVKKCLYVKTNLLY